MKCSTSFPTSKLSQFSRFLCICNVLLLKKKKKNHFFALISCIEGRCAVSQMVFGCCCDFCIFCFLEHPVFSDTSYCFFFNRNEHEGIPANLIHHLDVCVEIPQQGIIRSLNVHVSGALLIWEYTRQQVIKQKRRQ